MLHRNPMAYKLKPTYQPKNPSRLVKYGEIQPPFLGGFQTMGIPRNHPATWGGIWHIGGIFHDFPMEISYQDAPSGSIVTLPHPRAGPGLTAARARGVSKPRKACGEQLAGSGEMLQARPGANEGV